MAKINWKLVGIGTTILGVVATLLGSKAGDEVQKAEIEAAVDARFKELSENNNDVSDEEEEEAE